MVRKIILRLLLLVFIMGALFAGYNIYSIVTEHQQGKDLYSDVQQYISLAAPVPSSPASATPSPTGEAAPSPDLSPEVVEIPELPASPKPDLQFPEVDFEALQNVSDDVVGWVYIEGTNINYPVVQGKDNRHYVSTLMDGTPNSSGSIFMDFRNNPDFDDIHTILYGHNMNNKTMFHDIGNYRNQEYYDEHPIGLILTSEKNYYFEIVAGYVANLAESAWQLEFMNDADALEWLQSAIERSPFVSPVEPQPGDRMITLSTCSYEFNNARFVLVGILREG